MSETYIGVCYHALQHKKFPYKKAMRVFDGVKRPAISFLWSTFGKKRHGIKHFIETQKAKPHLVQIHLMNHVCVRWGNCKFPAEIAYKLNTQEWNRRLTRQRRGLKRKIQSRVRTIVKFCTKYQTPNTRFVLSVALEDNLSDLAADVLIQYVREVWPWEIVRNPVGMNSSRHHAPHHLELHGTEALKERGVSFFNLDGVDIRFPHRKPTIRESITVSETKSWLRQTIEKGAVAALLWSGLHQGISGDTTTSPPPRKRTPDVPMADVVVMNKVLLEAQ